MSTTHNTTEGKQKRAQDKHGPAKSWTTLILIALLLPVPLAAGMGLMTGAFSHSGHEALMSFASYYALWFVVDAIWLAWTVFKYRNEK